MRRWLILSLLVVLAAPAAAEIPAPAMRVVDVHSSVDLDPLARGRLRLWLSTHIEICRIDTKLRELRGDLQIHLDVAPRRATKVTVTATNRMPRPVAACVTRNLRRVQFADLAPRLVWDGTLHLDPDGPSIDVAVRSNDTRLDSFVVRSVILAALDEPADCITRFFTARPVISAVLGATLDATGAHVSDSTADVNGALACVTSVLGAVPWPPELLKGAQLRISLLRPTTDPDPDADVVRLDPATPRDRP